MDCTSLIWRGGHILTVFGHVAVRGGAEDCPYTCMADLAAGKYRLPSEEEYAHRLVAATQ